MNRLIKWIQSIRGFAYRVEHRYRALDGTELPSAVFWSKEFIDPPAIGTVSERGVLVSWRIDYIK